MCWIQADCCEGQTGTMVQGSAGCGAESIAAAAGRRLPGACGAALGAGLMIGDSPSIRSGSRTDAPELRCGNPLLGPFTL